MTGSFERGRLQPRGVEITGFTPILEGLVYEVDEALCAVFIDGEGETIDFATRIDPFEARILAAEMALPLASTLQLAELTNLGTILELRVQTSARSLLARHVTDRCFLVLGLANPTLRAWAAERCAMAAQALCVEAGQPLSGALSVLRAVELVEREGDAFPTAFVDGGIRRRVSAVLGVERHPDRSLYLVRTDEGEEVLVEHDHGQRLWRRTP